MFHATFKNLNGPKIDGGFTVSFEVDEQGWEEIRALPNTRGKMLLVNIWALPGDVKLPVKSHRDKLYALSQILIDELGWDEKVRREFVFKAFGTHTRTKLTDDQLSELVDHLMELTGEKPPAGSIEYQG
jgi:hypothetical protein